MKRMRFFGLLATLSVLLIVGCQGTSKKAAVDGDYTMVVTPDIQAQQELSLKEAEKIKERAANGDERAKKVIQVEGDKPVDVIALAQSVKLSLAKDSTFKLTMVDPKGGNHEFNGSYYVDDTKVTLTPIKRDGKELKKGENKPMQATYDEKKKELLCESGSGPKLLFKKN